MTTSAEQERADYFQEFGRRVIDRAAQLCKVAHDAPGIGRSGGNPGGEDLERADLDLIARVAAGDHEGLSPWREAQVRELAFWRWVAFNGYDGKDPRMFPLHQEHFMVSTFYRTGWSMAEFRDAAIFELGCGPLGMIEYLPGARRVAFDPLNGKYSRLFANFRDSVIEYISDRRNFLEDPASFDLAICHNALDHTDDPARWFDDLFGRLAPGGRFIFQVNLSKPEVPQSPEHRRLHPSPITFEQALAWLTTKSDGFEYVLDREPNRDSEFYFLSWGQKTRDGSVSYHKPTIAETDHEIAQAEAVSAPDKTKEKTPAGASAPRPLTSTFTSAWLSATTVKGGAEPFANLPPIAKLTPVDALEEQARTEFGLAEPVAGYRTGDTAPIPAPADREQYYGANHVGYWLSGLSDALSVTREAARLRLGAGSRYFELGCASGRVVRHLAFHTAVPITCCDINKRHIEWVRLFLPERINAFHSSAAPNLPLEDNSVDVVTAFSVFTHIDDFETAWLLELRRILRPGGLAYLTVASDHTWEQYKRRWIKEHLLPLADRIGDYTIDEGLFNGPLPREKTVFWWQGDHEAYAALVFHHASYIRREWGRIFTVREILPDRHFYQDVVLLTK
jgi:SAM-dependent methyltransferase